MGGRRSGAGANLVLATPYSQLGISEGDDLTPGADRAVWVWRGREGEGEREEEREMKGRGGEEGERRERGEG